jgi:hypothetical protein
MPLATSAATDALAYTLASLSGLTPDEAVACALRAELDRKRAAAGLQPAPQPEPTVEELLARIRSYGPWEGPTSAELAAELYDAEGLPR